MRAPHRYSGACGPGTLVMLQAASGVRSPASVRVARRAMRLSIAAGPCGAASDCSRAPTARSIVAELAVCAWIDRRRLSLIHISRLLKSRDPDLAVGQVVRAVEDWSGGTRITTSLHEFNQRWARRVLSGQATVLLVSDGLEHGDTQALGFEMDRLHKSCRRLIWLNPLLRFDRFEPRAGGIKAMLPHVDRFMPVHNLASLEQLVQVLARPDTPSTFR